jgi:hypothetical protein
MFKKLFIFAIIFYLLQIFQGSFLTHFFSVIPNLILVFVFLINLWEKRENQFGIFLALMGGFILDVFSIFFFGFFIILLVGLAFFIKIIIKNFLELSF